MNAPVRDRKYTVARVAHLLQRRGSPRLQMSLMLFTTALAGFFCSFILLRLGMENMAARYTLAVGFAYAIFLGLMRLWLYRQRRKTADRNSSGTLDLLDVDLPSASSEGVKNAGRIGFGGGSSGGGGASRSFAPGSGGALDNVGTGATGGFPFDLDADDLWILVLIVAAIGSALIVSIYLIIAAPTFLAEILVDGLLVTGLYKRLQKFDQQHWLETAIRKTWAPVLIVTVLFGIAGYFIQQLSPEVNSIGDLFQ